MPDLTGTTLGRYQILERVGRGGMADVYRAHQPSLDRDVAIKVLNPFLLNDSANSDRFRREAKAVAMLHHSNIVQVLDYDSEGETFYMVLAFIEGQTLKAVLDDHAAHGTHLSLGEIGTILQAIGSALSYAHSRGMIHRDIKPHNIMFTAEGTPMLTDFGIARMVHGSTASVSGGLSGTPAYMSPEQGKGEPLDARSDIYSLGVVLYEMLTSRVPFDADTPFAVVIKHMNDPLPPPRSINAAIPEPLERVVLRALAKSPADRYQTVDEMVQATQAAIAEAQGKAAATLPVLPAPAPAPVPVPVAPVPPVPARMATAVPTAAAVIVCPKCGGNNPAGSRYCDQCSAPLDGTLPPRSRTIPPAAAFSTVPAWATQPPTLAAASPLTPVAQPPSPATATAPTVALPVSPPSVPPIQPIPAVRPARSGGLSPALLVGALLAIGVFLGAGLIALLTSKSPAPADDPAALATTAAISVQSTQLVVQQLALQTTMTAAAGLSGAAQQTAVGAATAQAQTAAGTATALGVIAADSAATVQAYPTGTALAGITNASGQATAAANVTAVAAVTAQAAATAQAQVAAQGQAGTATAQAQAAGQAQAVGQAQTAAAGQASQATAAAQAVARQAVARTATAGVRAAGRQAATAQARQAAQTAAAGQAAQVAQTAAAAQAQAAIGRQVAAQTATAQAQAAAQALAAAWAAQTAAAAQAATAQAQAQAGQAQAQAGQAQAQAATAQARIAATGTAIAQGQAAAIDTRVARGFATATARAQAAVPPTAAGCSSGGSRSGSAAPSTLHVGDTVQFAATGFSDGEAVSYWFTAPNGEVAGTAAPVPGGVRDDGSVNFKPVKIPADFAQNYGRWAITVQGAGSGHQAVIFFCVVQ